MKPEITLDEMIQWYSRSQEPIRISTLALLEELQHRRHAPTDQVNLLSDEAEPDYVNGRTSEAADEIEELRREVAKVRRWLGKTGRPLEAPLVLKPINNVSADLRGLQETIRRDAEPDYVKELRHEKLVTGNWENF